MQNLQIPNTAETRIIPKWLFPPRFSDKNRFTSGCCTGCSHLHKNTTARLAMKGGGFLGVAGWNWGRMEAFQQHRPPLADPSPPDSTDPKISAFSNVRFTIEIKYCEDTRPQNQLNAAKEQHKYLCNILQGPSVSLHIILLGVGGRHHLQHSHSEAFQGTGSWFSNSKEACLQAPCALRGLCCCPY